MKGNKHCPQESRRAHPFNAGHFQGRTGIVLGLCVVLGAGLISVHAANTPDPAAVRAADSPVQAATPTAREQKLNEPNRLQTLPSPASLRLPVLITPSGIEKKPRRIYAAISSGKC
jgi:hypothetical protein